ncbi:hypothetical protein N0V90_013244 [Kalmusia sp. IMI 367209]|nr:hypothetical protein N0V90_013244 [Kalmusia sp. IMI 367209]
MRQYPLDVSERNDNFSIWDAKQQEVIPACRIEPSSAVNISTILQTLITSWCHFSVKGGGHGREPNDSNSVGGVTIDLDRLTTVQIAPNGESARVGGGADLTESYTALQARNLSFVGGRVGTVGVGGFTLGGGTSPFANRNGWALDNVYEYEVVLANGTITTASEEQNPDLYFALRGGGNNFGIVTAFTIRTFPSIPIYRGAVAYSDNQTESVLDGVHDLFTNPEKTSDLDVGYDMYYQYNQNADQFVMAGTQWYNAPVTRPAVFEQLNRIPAIRNAGSVQTMSQSVTSGGPLGTVRHVFGTLTTLPSRPFLSQAVAIFKEEVNSVKEVQGLAPNLICYALPARTIGLMAQRGGNALGIESDGPLLIWLISSGWSSADGDTAIDIMTANVANRMEKAAKALEVHHPYKYINYASATQAPGIYEGYGGKNLRRLINVQKAVDPRGIFTSQGLWKGFMKLI